MWNVIPNLGLLANMTCVGSLCCVISRTGQLSIGVRYIVFLSSCCPLLKKKHLGMFAKFACFRKQGPGHPICDSMFLVCTYLAWIIYALETLTMNPRLSFATCLRSKTRAWWELLPASHSWWAHFRPMVGEYGALWFPHCSWMVGKYGALWTPVGDMAPLPLCFMVYYVYCLLNVLYYTFYIQEPAWGNAGVPPLVRIGTVSLVTVSKMGKSAIFNTVKLLTTMCNE